MLFQLLKALSQLLNLNCLFFAQLAFLVIPFTFGAGWDRASSAKRVRRAQVLPVVAFIPGEVRLWLQRCPLSVARLHRDLAQEWRDQRSDSRKLLVGSWRRHSRARLTEDPLASWRHMRLGMGQLSLNFGRKRKHSNLFQKLINILVLVLCLDHPLPLLPQPPHYIKHRHCKFFPFPLAPVQFKLSQDQADRGACAANARSAVDQQLRARRLFLLGFDEAGCFLDKLGKVGL